MPARADRPARLNYIVKIAARCNLSCSYCYVYHQADSSWREQPSLMSRETFAAVVAQILRHCQHSGQPEVQIVFHGGEPTLVGAERFAWMCAHARERLGELTRVRLSIQTNATRLDEAWVTVLAEHDVQVGVSLDGPAEVHDRQRVDHRGRGSHAATLRGIGRLRAAGMPFAILAVVQPGADPLPIYRHFRELGCRTICYLLPSETHDSIGDLQRRLGATPCSDYLIPVFDEWWDGPAKVTVREFRNLVRLILGGQSRLEAFGNPPLHFVGVETDGSIQGLDKLRSCENGLRATGLNVHEHEFAQIAQASPFHASVMRGLPLPTGCRECPERSTCAGGHLPTRYSRARGFDNPSVWCDDLLALFGHARRRLGINPHQTADRRERLTRLRERAAASG